jgi:hypothetical protein
MVLKRQFITDSAGNPVGVILPLEEFALVEEIIEEHFPTQDEADKLNQAGRLERSVREAEYFGMWADREDMHGLSSREWLDSLRAQQWKLQ